MGDASITRDQFSEFKADGSTVLRKIIQQGTYIADADANEIGQIAQHRSARSLWNLLNRVNSRFGTGWIITGGTNQVTVAAGDAGMQVETDKAHVFHLGSNTNVTGWTTPAGSGRTDYLYLDVQLPIIDSADDATLVNPAVGKETAVDQRLKFTFVKQMGGSVPSAPANHYYITIATITRYNGQATINNGDIANGLQLWKPLQLSSSASQTVTGSVQLDGSVQLNAAMACATGIRIDGIDLDKSYELYYVHKIEAGIDYEAAITDWDTGGVNGCFKSSQSNGNYAKKLRVGIHKHPNVTKIRARYERKNNNTNITTGVKLTITGYTVAESAANEAGNSWHWEEQVIDVTAAAENDDLSILMEMKSDPVSPSTYFVSVRKLIIYGTVN